VLLLKIGAEYPEPVTYAELAKDADIAVASVSRNIKILGEKMIQNSKGNWIDVGLGFVTARPNPYNSREHVAELTKKGKALMAKVNSAMTI
jgi:DNA-binding MarR family transcriptional regulator